MRFGDNLKRLRKKKNISQEELATKVGVSRQSVSKWECGEAYPEMNNILLLCEIFHCKINELIQENMVDIDSLDAEIKNKVVKLKKEKQQKLKMLSKGIYFIAKIGKIVTLLGTIFTVAVMIITMIVGMNTKIINSEKIEIFGEAITYQRKSNRIVINYQNKSTEIEDVQEVNTLNTLNKIWNWVENKSITTIIIFMEVAYTCLMISLILLFFTLRHLETLFKNIHNGETPFTKENIEHIKKMALYMSLTILIPNIVGVICECIIQSDLDIEIEIFDFIYILFLLSLSYIFEYGYEIQLDSTGKIYGEEDE